MTFAFSIWLQMVRKYDKGTFCKFQQYLGLVNMFTAEEFSEARVFMHLSKHVFRSQ